MSIATSLQAQDPREPRGLMLTLLRAVFALCIMTFMVGGPTLSSLETSPSELSSQDSASVGEADASPWLRRSTSGTKFVGIPYGLTYDDFVLPDPRVEDVTIQRPVELVVALVTESRHAAPVRGPPCA
jgi:hypothetical protein